MNTTLFHPISTVSSKVKSVPKSNKRPKERRYAREEWRNSKRLSVKRKYRSRKFNPLS